MLLDHLRDAVTQMETYLDRGLMHALALSPGASELGSQPKRKLSLLMDQAKARELMPPTEIDRLHAELLDMFEYRGRITHSQVFPSVPPADAMLIRSRAGVDHFTPTTRQEVGERLFDIVGVSRGPCLRARLWDLVTAFGGGFRQPPQP
jgi:hypothetical protein